jgi:hypothetical protein
VQAQLLQPLPAERVIAIEPRDDSDENLKLRDLMAARLVEQHGSVAADAPMVLRFSTAVVSPRDAAAANGATGTGGRRGGGRSGGGRTPPNAAPVPANTTYRLTATLEQRAGAVLWKAEVTARPSAQDERQLPARLAAVLIDNLGKTVDTRRPADAPANAAR